MKSIDLSNNFLATLEESYFKEVTQVEEIFLTNNVINSIDENTFAENLQLKRIFLSDNYIQNFSSSLIQNNSMLKLLNLDLNYFEHLSDNFLISDSLEILNLIYCQVKTISSLAFKSLPSLKTLRMAHNFVATLPNDLMVPSSLKSVDLCFNSFEDEVYLPQDLFKVTSVLLNTNAITDFVKFSEEDTTKISLNYIDLSGNPLLLENENVTWPDVISQATTVVLISCQLYKFPSDLFNSTSRVQNLYLDQNNFVNLTDVFEVIFGKRLKRLSLKYLDLLNEVSYFS